MGYILTGNGVRRMAHRVEHLLAQAHENADRLDLQAAVMLCRQACSIDSTSVEALDTLSEFCLQAGKTEEAMRALQRSVKLAPEGRSGRFMYLGQLSTGQDALHWFERGLSMLRAERTQLQNTSGSRQELQLQWVASTQALAAALCTVAEVYLTDECEEPHAESTCEALAAEAMQLVSSLDEQSLPEPYQTMASLRMSRQRPAEAEPLVMRALEITDSLDATQQQPSLEMRTALAKLLMEVEHPAEALDLLQALRMEDDESLELWYLLCCAAQQAGELDLAHAELEQALQFAQAPACPPEEKEWLSTLEELLAAVELDSDKRVAKSDDKASTASTAFKCASQRPL